MLRSFLTDIAVAIRSKTGGSELIPAQNFPDEILNIPTGDTEYFYNNNYGWYYTAVMEFFVNPPQMSGSEHLKEVVLHNGVTTLLKQQFYLCMELKKVYLPNTLTSAGSGTAQFSGCPLETIVFEDEFNCNGLTFKMDTITTESLVGMLNALKDRTDETPYTLTLGEINLAKLTPEQIAVAVDKNWTLL